MFNGFIKLDFDYSVSSFWHVVVDEVVESIKWHNRPEHIGKHRLNRLAKEHLLGL